MPELTPDLVLDPHHGPEPDGPGPLTEADYWNFPDDGVRRVLADGWILVIGSPRVRHQEIVGNLYRLMANHLHEAPEQGKVYLSPLAVRLSERTILEPDLLVLTGEQLGQIEERQIRDAPALAIEVLSPSTRRHDELRKLRLYERHGVAEYWIFDPDIDGVRVRRRQGERLVLAEELFRDHDDRLASPLLPGLALPLTEVFPALD